MMSLFKFNQGRHEPFLKFEDAVSKIEHVHLQYENSLIGSQLNVTSDNYTEIRYNIFVRVIQDKNDIKFSNEESARAILEKLDFNKNVVMAVKFDKGEGFPAHTHEVYETLRCFSGSYRDDVGNVTYSAGDVQYVKPLQLHSFRPIQKGFAIVELTKQ